MPAAIEQEKLVTVLVVDDHRQLRETAVGLLHLLGHRTLQATNAQEAERAVAEHGAEIEVVLLDYQLGDSSGALLAQRLERARPGLRVLLMSGYGREDLGGIDGRPFISKPFSVRSLEGALRAILQG